jgi:hypothetical protein
MRAPASIIPTLAGIALALAGCGDGESEEAEPVPGQPSVEVLSPRDGSKQRQHSVVVKVRVRNFTLAPAHFEQPPELGEGHIRFSLNQVPTGVEESEEEEAAANPLGAGRAIGRSFDYPRFSGPNGVLARRTGSPGKYSPATAPEIYYTNLPEGSYRLIITLAHNDGTATPFHTVTHFRIDASD